MHELGLLKRGGCGFHAGPQPTTSTPAPNSRSQDLHPIDNRRELRCKLARIDRDHPNTMATVAGSRLCAAGAVSVGLLQLYTHAVLGGINNFGLQVAPGFFFSAAHCFGSPAKVLPAAGRPSPAMVASRWTGTFRAWGASCSPFEAALHRRDASCQGSRTNRRLGKAKRDNKRKKKALEMPHSSGPKTARETKRVSGQAACLGSTKMEPGQESWTMETGPQPYFQLWRVKCSASTAQRQICDSQATAPYCVYPVKCCKNNRACAVSACLSQCCTVHGQQAGENLAHGRTTCV